MKLREITLNDVRQFTSPVKVTGFQDGLNVLAAPNESGKSTIFDAIQALFFIPHRSRLIAPLKPAIGGNPEITVQIDHEGAQFTLFKRWGRKATAEVTQNGRLIAKADEAEEWITNLTIAAGDGGAEAGPAGLLWVRQGVTELGTGAKKELEAAQTARRDLMSSVTGEFETVTGGRRMDRALAQAQSELDALVTQRGPKAGGPLALAVDAVARLETRRAELEAKSTQLRDALDARRVARRDLAEVSDPKEVQERSARLQAAQAALDAAGRHDAQCRLAAQTLSAAQSEVQRLTTQTQDRARIVAALEQLGTELQGREAEAARFAQQVQSAQDSLTQATQAAESAREKVAQIETQLGAASKLAGLGAKIAQRNALKVTLDQAQNCAKPLPKLLEQAQTGPDRAALDQMEAAQRELDLAAALAKAAAPQITLHYTQEETPRARIGDNELAEDTPLAVTQPTEIALPGYGRLHISPGGGAGPSGHGDLERNLAALLSRHSVPDIEHARAAFRARHDAGRAAETAKAELARLAPNGVDALRAQLLQLEQSIPAEDAPGPDDAPDIAQIEQRLTAARAEAETAQTQRESARATVQAQTEASLRAKVEAEGLAGRIADGRARLAELPAPKQLGTQLDAALEAEGKAAQAHQTLVTSAPDLTACRAAFERAQQVQANAQAEISSLTTELARLDAVIEIQAGDGVDEDLAECSEQLTAASATKGALEHEVAVLTCLITALTDAQSAARDRYFEPVLQQLRPMLGLLWPGADLQFDGDSLLPNALLRDGESEPLGSLSGGTREQIALLVRLAFARLLAQSGRHAPVILDDALVYTDDLRIEQMFDALHAQASDLQIIVLSCRNKALRALGGNKLSITPIVPTA